LKRVEHDTGRSESNQLLKPAVLSLSVGFIAEDRKAQELEVDSDLVSPAGMERGFDQGGLAQAFQNAITGPGRPAGVVPHRHALPVRRVPGDGGVDFATVAGQLAAKDGVIELLDFPSGELGGQGQVGFVILGDDEASAGFLVEAVDDAGAGDAADAAELARAMVEQGVDERVFLVSGGGMHDQAGSLVQNQERLVLEEDVQRHFLSQGFGRLRLRPSHLDAFPGPRRVRGFHPGAVDQDMPLFNETLDSAA
jgi:hypothetical protein